MINTIKEEVFSSVTSMDLLNVASPAIQKLESTFTWREKLDNWVVENEWLSVIPLVFVVVAIVLLFATVMTCHVIHKWNRCRRIRTKVDRACPQCMPNQDTYAPFTFTSGMGAMYYAAP